MSFPLDWTKQYETLLREVVGRPGIVVVQGGLAPVGVLLAHRDRKDQNLLVQSLVLTSPPTWEDMVNPVPQSELDQNYNFLRSPILGSLAFQLLETRQAIKFFSNLFLFEDKCDEEWLEKTCDGCVSPEARPPVMAFNAGFLNHRSWEEELREIVQPTLIVGGRKDARMEKRKEYGVSMSDCVLKTIPGCNVLPWESAIETIDAILEFCNERKFLS